MPTNSRTSDTIPSGAGALFVGGKVRVSIVVACTLLMAVAAVRYALVRYYVTRDPQIAAAVWHGHPDVLANEIINGVTSSAVRGTGLSPETQQDLRQLAVRAPLSAQPFAVEAAVALRKGDYSRAKGLLEAAQLRDPRDVGVRLLLAQVYLHDGKTTAGLQQLVVVAQISPAVAPAVASLLTSYAQVPGSAPQLRKSLQTNPQLQSSLLETLAADPKNAGLVLSLAGPIRGRSELLPWQNKLLTSLVNAGDGAAALRLLSQFSPQAKPDIGNFEDNASGSPFSWTLVSGAGGAAEARGRALDVDYSGQQDLVLASTFVAIPPGKNAVTFNIAKAPSGEGLHLALVCTPGGKALIDAPLSRIGPNTLPFAVQNDCPAQKVIVKGLAQVYPADLSLTLADLKVVPLP